MDELTRMARHGFGRSWVDEAHTHLLDTPLKDAAAAYGALAELVDGFTERLDSLAQTYRPSALADPARKAAAEALSAIDKHASKAKALRERLDDLAERARPKSEMDPSAEAIYVTALWAMLPRDQLELTQIYADAIEVRDPLTTKAIESLPSALPASARLSEEQISEGRRRSAMLNDPLAAKQLENHEDALADLEHAAEVARATIRDRIARIAADSNETAPVDDPLARMAMTGSTDDVVATAAEAAE